ncbi:MAG: sulfatase-like hydrolase/transferase [Chitinophagaceae bacterium]
MKGKVTGFVQSKLIRWLLLNGLFFLLTMSLLRLVFHLLFAPSGEKIIFKAFWMGFRYDARVVCIFLLAVWIVGLFHSFKPFTNKISRKTLLIFSRFFGVLLIIIYTFDFAHFAYLRQRLNASVLSYAEDAGISIRMVWESYPVLKILLGWVFGFAVIFYATRFLYRISNKPPEIATKKNRVLTYSICFLVFAVAIFGRIGQFPLRWSDAYRLNSDYKASLALNPFQSFASSLKFRGATYDIEKAKQYYSLISSQLGVSNPDSAKLNFLRKMVSNDSGMKSKPNIVLVICESFSAYKSSMWGNPLNTTPYFNSLCEKGIFFKNCFSPAYGTARGVWAIITGVPDVTELKTASRNPNLVDQHTILNDIKGYEKFYFIGGSASWANIRGVLKGNIKDLKLYEQEDYKSPSIDVWGISDKNLFLEANTVLKKQTSPFFAVIQTADNHRPYSIPAEDKPNIKFRNLPKDTLEKYGFWTNEELNAYSYMDYTYRVFIEAASREKYFNNTIFVFIGDHGIRGNAGDMMPKVWTNQGLTTQHVPLLFYAPSMLQPSVKERKVSQVDIMPGIAHLANLEVSNTTLGRNIFSTPFSADSISNHTFVIDPDKRTIGLLSGKYYYEFDLKTKKDGIYSLVSNASLPPGEPADTLVSKMRDITFGYYEISRYMLFNNKKAK